MNPSQSASSLGQAKPFYQFLGAHSLLIGLLPFFLPVYLWQNGLDLSNLCLLIGMSGVSFVAVLRPWQYLWRNGQLKPLITSTFILELLLVGAVGFFTTTPGAALFPETSAQLSNPSFKLALAAATIGLLNGLYNAFFWTTQRCLFVQQLGANDTGKQYGNFQIFVTLFLKFGILLGGLLLDKGGFVWLLALSAGVGFAASSYLSTRLEHGEAKRHDTTTLFTSLRFRDNCGSRPVFAIDGIFLYLESHFWTLSLFLVVREDFSRLGIAVVLLALSFAVVFLLIKNRIDQLPADRVFKAAVWLYAASWVLRATLGMETTGADVLSALVFITFCSSFFRLAFNKRFFDIAKNTDSHGYLLIKSYCSQTYIGVSFLLLALCLQSGLVQDLHALQYGYLPAALLALTYLRYRRLQ